jgi:hypothetical protein
MDIVAYQLPILVLNAIVTLDTAVNSLEPQATDNSVVVIVTKKPLGFIMVHELMRRWLRMLGNTLEQRKGKLVEFVGIEVSVPWSVLADRPSCIEWISSAHCG